MSEHAFWSPNSGNNESGVSVYSHDDERFAGWSSLPEPLLVRVAFPENKVPVFETSAEADLVFTGSGEIRLFVPRAIVVRCEYTPGQTIYLFKVRETQWENIRDSLSPRRSVRVEPATPIPVRIVSAAEGLVGEVGDVSESGVSIRLAREVESEILRPGLHSLSFKLPEENEPIEITARLRYRAAEDEETIRCGFEFDAKATSEFRDKRWRIARYVWGAQESPEEDE